MIDRYSIDISPVKMQYLLSFQKSKYCLLALHKSVSIHRFFMIIVQPILIQFVNNRDDINCAIQRQNCWS